MLSDFWIINITIENTTKTEKSLIPAYVFTFGWFYIAVFPTRCNKAVSSTKTRHFFCQGAWIAHTYKNVNKKAHSLSFEGWKSSNWEEKNTPQWKILQSSILLIFLYTLRVIININYASIIQTRSWVRNCTISYTASTVDKI